MQIKYGIVKGFDKVEEYIHIMKNISHLARIKIS